MKRMVTGSLVLAIVLGLLMWSSVAWGADPAGRVGFLSAQSCGQLSASETEAAFRLAKELADATFVQALAEGKFVDGDGKDVKLDQFTVLWFHQGDSSEPCGPIHDPKTLAALGNFVAKGRSLYLSGAALALVHSLRVEKVPPRLGSPGRDRASAAMVPVEKKHPIFRDLQVSGQMVPLSDAGYPAFADFHGTGGPRGGMLLARSPGGSENPLIEYELGKGRIIAMGWRLPHYGHVKNVHNGNLKKLTGNILAYLANAKQWQPVVIKAVSGPAPAPAVATSPGVPAEQWRALRMAINDLKKTFTNRYPKGAEYLQRLETLQQTHDKLLASLMPQGGRVRGDKETRQALDQVSAQFNQIRGEALLANPLLDFERLLLVKRSEKNLGLPRNWQGNACLPRLGFDNELAVLSPVRPDGQLTTLFKPVSSSFVGDVDLHWGADRFLFSMIGKNRAWQVFELGTDGKNLRQLPLIPDDDVDNYDACYLPDGNVIFTSTAPFVGVPCVTGSSHVGNTYRFDKDTKKIRQLTFDQDHNWCPTVLNNGKVMFLRWEYSDLPHFVSRILFHMNPDGTEQMEYYGSNSYWPNAMFYARPVPNHPTKFVAVVGGHHDHPRMGELVLFDPAKGRFEADGAVQRIPGHGKKVQAIIKDGLAQGSWPLFLHPWPLSDKYFLVSAKLNPQSKWGIYLVDTFDNMVLLKELDGYALLEPTPIRQREKPPVIPSRIQPERKDATVHIADIYSGPGLTGIPKGTVKNLRLFTYHFSYHRVGGQTHRVGMDGPWDVKRVLGTVPVEQDGSAFFRVPANTPLSVQPLDGEGKALQLMRSWMTAMPGEHVSCIGCHDKLSTSPGNRHTLAMLKSPADIKPWYGPTRGFSFRREVQPVLDKHCIGCHNGQSAIGGRPAANGQSADSRQPIADFTDRPDVNLKAGSEHYNKWAKFPPSYIALRSFARAPTIESDMHLLTPMEFHADTTRLVQLLRQGHHGVKLDREAWDRIITWIDLNTPAHGAWHDIVGLDHVAAPRERRRDLLKRYANRDDDPEAYPLSALGSRPSALSPLPGNNQKPKVDGQKIAESRKPKADGRSKTIDLGHGLKLELVLIPAGQFVMGQAQGPEDERPSLVGIDRPFWMGSFEITNEQFRLFDPNHDSRLEVGDFLHFSEEERGYPTNLPRQPVCRVSWKRALDFCNWLSHKTGQKFSLPTEAQWEYACRAGTDTAMSYGQVGDDFSRLANLADASLRKVDLFGWGLPVGAVPPWRPADTRFNDGARVSTVVGSYRPNPWGLFDMHGNVAEWTLSRHLPYPYADGDGRNDLSAPGRRVVRGGSWDDRPQRARSAFRQSYWPYQPVYDVGFRVICDEAPAALQSRR